MTRVSLSSLPDGRQVLRWREHGKHKQQTLRASRRVAERRRAEIEDRLSAGLPDPSRYTLADLGRAYFEANEHRWTDKTLLGYSDQWNRLILPALGGLRLDRLRGQQVTNWLAEMEQDGVGREQQRKTLTRLRAILSFGVAQGILGVNPATGVRTPKAPPKRPIIVTAPIDVERMRVKALGAGRDRDALIYSLLFYLGLRPGEVFGLTAGAVGEKLTVDRRRTLKIIRECGKPATGGQIEAGSKTNTIREVDLPELVAAELRDHAARFRSDELIFANADGRPLTENQYGAWSRRRFGVDAPDRVTPYSARHSAASLMILSGRSINYVARQLGHSPAECLKTYQHVVDELEFAERISVNKNIARARRQVRRESSRLKVVS